MTSANVQLSTDSNTSAGFFQTGSTVGSVNKYVKNSLWSPTTL